jgi:hypothetical protein
MQAGREYEKHDDVLFAVAGRPPRKKSPSPDEALHVIRSKKQVVLISEAGVVRRATFGVQLYFKRVSRSKDSGQQQRVLQLSFAAFLALAHARAMWPMANPPMQQLLSHLSKLSTTPPLALLSFPCQLLPSKN